MTVRGPVAPDALGVTLVHEHLLCDLRSRWHAPLPDRPDLAALVDVDPRPHDRGPLSGAPYVSRLNLLLDDPDLAVAELAYLRAAGGGAVVELTTQGLHPRPAVLRDIAQRSGLHIVAGCGWYRAVTAPPGLRDLSEAEMVERLVSQIHDGFTQDQSQDQPSDGSVRPGIIGEIGTGDPIHPHEAKALRAAARAQQATGLAIAVHLALWGRQGEAVLDILEGAGADPTRVLLCHLGEQPSALDYQRALLDRGAGIGFDTFGAEYALDSAGRRLATDEERLTGVCRLLGAGYARQLFLSQDICERLQLRAYGGFGYAHLLTTIRPRLRRAGVDEATLDLLLRQNPSRLLTTGPH
ncbi:MAG: phosphotriesterase-related protein [Chloroflexota bacterium]|nr:phosphotriesterase-related protein [Chloroflexota bacterium]